jgi:1-deoxy-D-xylulose 5-phosphate reductoisomerase
MIIPIANAIFDEKIYIKDFLIKENKFIHQSSKKNLFFKTVDHKKFPIIKIKKKIDLLPSSSIIINACNEILVDQFLRGNIPFLAISKTIMTILKHRNYKEFAIKKPNHLQIIYKIDKWTRNVTNELLKKYK